MVLTAHCRLITRNGIPLTSVAHLENPDPGVGHSGPI